MVGIYGPWCQNSLIPMLIAVFLDFFYQFDHVTRVGNHYKKKGESVSRLHLLLLPTIFPEALFSEVVKIRVLCSKRFILPTCLTLSKPNK